MANAFDQFDSGNAFDQFDEGATRRTPKAMKIGAEGFSDALREEFRSRSVPAQMLAAAGTFPRQMYEGLKQRAGEVRNALTPTSLSDLIVKRKNPYEDNQAIQAMRVMEEERPYSALAGAVGSLTTLGRVPGINTIAGSAATGGATGLLTPTQGNESVLSNVLVDSLFGGGASAILKGAGYGLRKLLDRGATKATEQAAQNTVRDSTLSEGRSIGLVLPGSATGERGAIRKAVESIAGKAALGQEASIRNQKVINEVARKEAGLKPNEAITESTLKAARDRLSEPYREVAKLSPKAAQALEKMKEIRADSKAQWNFYNRSGDPKALKAAQALDAKADGLESAIEKEAGRLGQQGLRSVEAKAAGQASGLERGKDLVTRLREARVALAKNYSVEKAVNLGSGDVDAAVLGRMYDKVGDKGMTGGLRTVAKFQQAFPDFMRSKPSGQVGPGVGALRPYAAALGLGVGAEYGREHYGLSPYMLGAATLPLLGGPARSMALSKLMQRAPSYGPSALLRGAEGASRSPLIPMGAIPLADVANQQ